MIKTLYVRIVLTYLVAVIIGLVSTFFLSVLFLKSYGDSYANKLHTSLLKDGASMQSIFQKKGIAGAEPVLKQDGNLSKYEYILYDSLGNLSAESKDQTNDIFYVSNQAMRSVLNGETYRGLDVAPTELIIGLPVELSGKHYALFIQTPEKTVASIILRFLAMVLLFSLFAGSTVMIIAARYLVKPLRGMKAAAEKMATGEFNIKLKWGKSKDELGQLAHSFNDMASQMGELETMRQNFVSNVSHEIQSPLTSISGFSKALQQSSLPEETRIQYLLIIQNESERLSRLSDNLLKLASLDSTQHPFEARIYDLDEQLRKVVVASEPQWSAKSLDWQLHLPKTKINADEDQLNQVWINLVGNSIKFTPDGGLITLTLVKHTDFIEIILKDTGIGIPEEEQGKVFERFYKVDKSHTKIKSGSGLGLAIVRKIVIGHGGTVAISSNPAGGTIVKVTLPLQK